MTEKQEPTLHFLGVGGTGMAPLALLLLKSEIKISGYDQNLSSPTIVKLQKNGLFLGDPTEYKPSTVVVSSAFKEDHPEWIKYRNQNALFFHRSDLLSSLLTNAEISVTVSGTHGKTTTTGMLGYMLREQATTIFGGEYQEESWEPCFDGAVFIAEADESDGTHMKYKPHVSIITGLAFDHPDFYASHEDLIKSFQVHLQHIKTKGALVYHWDCPWTRALALQEIPEERRFSFGFEEGADLRCTHIKPLGLKTQVTIAWKEKILLGVVLPFFGRHNIANWMAASLACQIISEKKFETHSKDFAMVGWPSIKKRQTILYDQSPWIVIDDYAHNPEKISAFVLSLQEAWPQKKKKKYIVCEPHRYSRVMSLFLSFAKSFQKADHVFLMPIYGAHEPVNPEYSPDLFAEAIRHHSNVSVSLVQDPADLITQLRSKEYQAGGILAFVGAGNSSQWAKKCAEDFSRK